MKEYVNKTKEMLEARIDQVKSLEEKINLLNDELIRYKQVSDD